MFGHWNIDSPSAHCAWYTFSHMKIMYAQFAGTDWKQIWLTSALCAWVFFVGHAVGLSAAPGDTPALKSGSNSSFQGGSAKAMARDKKLVEDTTASASDSERRVTAGQMKTSKPK